MRTHPRVWPSSAHARYLATVATGFLVDDGDASRSAVHDGLSMHVPQPVPEVPPAPPPEQPPTPDVTPPDIQDPPPTPQQQPPIVDPMPQPNGPVPIRAVLLSLPPFHSLRTRRTAPWTTSPATR